MITPTSLFRWRDCIFSFNKWQVLIWNWVNVSEASEINFNNRNARNNYVSGKNKYDAHCRRMKRFCELKTLSKSNTLIEGESKKFQHLQYLEFLSVFFVGSSNFRSFKSSKSPHTKAWSLMRFANHYHNYWPLIFTFFLNTVWIFIDKILANSIFHWIWYECMNLKKTLICSNWAPLPLSL